MPRTNTHSHARRAKFFLSIEDFSPQLLILSCSNLVNTWSPTELYQKNDLGVASNRHVPMSQSSCLNPLFVTHMVLVTFCIPSKAYSCIRILEVADHICSRRACNASRAAFRDPTCYVPRNGGEAFAAVEERLRRFLNEVILPLGGERHFAGVRGICPASRQPNQSPTAARTFSIVGAAAARAFLAPACRMSSSVSVSFASSSRLARNGSKSR